MNEEVFKIRKDFERAKSIFELAKDRASLITIYPEDKTYKIIEEYYEAIKELIVAFMYIEGCKTLSHIEMIKWFAENCDLFSDVEIKLIDHLRKLRNGTLYYGEKINKIFLENNNYKIKNILKKLIKFVGGKF